MSTPPTYPTSAPQPSSPSNEPSSIPPPPSALPAPTGSIPTDIYNSVTNVTSIPCARTSLLSGIASGLGIGIVRGLSAGALTAGNWGVGAFLVVSLGTFQMCQNNLAREREQVTKIIENMPRKLAKEAAPAPETK